MTLRSNDPSADFLDYIEECAAYEALCPVCAVCGEHITDEYYYQVGKTIFHEGCAERHSVDAFVNKYED